MTNSQASDTKIVGVLLLPLHLNQVETVIEDLMGSLFNGGVIDTSPNGDIQNQYVVRITLKFISSQKRISDRQWLITYVHPVLYALKTMLGLVICVSYFSFHICVYRHPNTNNGNNDNCRLRNTSNIT